MRDHPAVNDDVDRRTVDIGDLEAEI